MKKHLPITCIAAIAAALSAGAPSPRDDLPARNREFLDAVRDGHLDRAIAFFPRSGHVTHVETHHDSAGARVGVWRLPASQARESPREGYFSDLLGISYEGESVGSFAHQVMMRGTGWRRARGTRFVPAGAADTSALFVEWRREDGAWVVSTIGDESFGGGAPLPRWCC